MGTWMRQRACYTLETMVGLSRVIEGSGLISGTVGKDVGAHVLSRYVRGRKQVR